MIQQIKMYQYICDKCGTFEYFLTGGDAEEDGWQETDEEVLCSLCYQNTPEQAL